MARNGAKNQAYPTGRIAYGHDGTDAHPLNVNASGDQVVWNGATGIGHGVMTVTTAGTDLVLTTSTTIKSVMIQAQTDNTGAVAIGASGVDATVATGTGIILYAGDMWPFEVNDLALIYVDATVSGEGVRYTYFT